MKHWLPMMLICATPAMAVDNSVYIDQVGSGNGISVTQEQTGKTAIILNQGDGSTLAIIQEDGGHHSAFIGTPPTGMSNGRYLLPGSAGSDANVLGIAQSGRGNHTAAINVDPSVPGGGNGATIVQSGAADKQFTLNLSGSNIGATVVQDNYGTADTGSMSIQCYTGSCTGYTYERH